MKGALAAAISLMVLLAVLFALAPRREIVASIDISAPPARVWAVLTDTRDYAAWNPHMRLTGNLVPGAVIENDEGEGDDRMVFWPTVLVARPGEELRWLGHYKVPGLFDAEHYFLLRPDGAATRLTQGERFRGVALWFFDVATLVPGFSELNVALKAQAERSR